MSSSEGERLARRQRLSRLRSAYYRHERALAVVYLAALGVALAVLAVRPLRLWAVQAVEAGARRWDARWEGRTAEAVRLAAAGDHESAAAYIEELDRELPATDIRHKDSFERERLLQLLGESYVALDRKDRALATYGRLIAFSPRSHINRYLAARAALRFDEPDLARMHLDSALAIDPSHLPSVREMVRYHLARGDSAAAVKAYLKYLDALLFLRVRPRLEDTVMAVVPVDARLHDVTVSTALPPGWSGELAIPTRGFAIEVERVTLVPALRVGEPAPPSSMTLSSGGADWRADGMTVLRPGLFLADDTLSVVRVPVPTTPHHVGRVVIRMRLFKPVDEELWQLFEQGARSTGEPRLDEARDRSLVLPSAAVADRARVPEL